MRDADKVADILHKSGAIKFGDFQLKSKPKVKVVECCFGCQVHHFPTLHIEEMLGKCQCSCHQAGGKVWGYRVKLEVPNK